MQLIEQALIVFFERVAQRDAVLIKNIEQAHTFSLDSDRWCFTLPELHAFLQYQDMVFNQVDYRQFRQLIYNSSINQSVKSHGAEITIADNQNSVDKSSYALVWLSGNRSKRACS